MVEVEIKKQMTTDAVGNLDGQGNILRCVRSRRVFLECSEIEGMVMTGVSLSFLPRTQPRNKRVPSSSSRISWSNKSARPRQYRGVLHSEDMQFLFSFLRLKSHAAVSFFGQCVVEMDVKLQQDCQTYGIQLRSGFSAAMLFRMA